MASIKPIDSSSVHRIQSGQVIVDLCSVVKELVENSIDAGATSIEVRFKNQGLDAIEVADNGSGIGSDDYESVALKHYTSKLRSYDDLSNLDTFGFRGEALSSLCALSHVHVTTCQDHEAPKGTKLEFEPSGKLRDRTMTAASRGTTVTVENIFKNLPVRRQELTRNIKREYGKVLGLLQAYACISTKTKFAVSNVPWKGKKTIQFATKAGQTTRENIANVYSTKTTAALMPLDLEFDMQPTSSVLSSQRSKHVRIVGHVSRPTLGEGRQTPDRQMFFVNGRPCALPQVAKVMNDVYKGYNLSQSPFIFADIQLDTNAYDVNVSPDKRTIMLHEQTELLESLRESLTALFDNQRQSVPQAKGTPVPRKSIAYSLPGTPLPATGISTVFRNTTGNARVPAFNPLTISKPTQDPALEYRSASAVIRPETRTSELDAVADHRDQVHESPVHSVMAHDVPPPAAETGGQSDLVQKLFTHKVQDRRNPLSKSVAAAAAINDAAEASNTTNKQHYQDADEEPLFVEGDLPSSGVPFSEHSDGLSLRKTQADSTHPQIDTQTLFPSAQSANTDSPTASEQMRPTTQAMSATLDDRSAEEEPIPSTHPSPVKATPGPVQSAFDRMRPYRTPTQTAMITIGDQTTTTTIGSSTQRSFTFQQDTTKSKTRSKKLPKQSERSAFQSSLKAFAAPGSQMRQEAEEEIEDGDDNVGVAPRPVPSRASRPLRVSAPVPTKKVLVWDESRQASPAEPDNADLGDVEQQGTMMVDEMSENDSDGEYLDEDAKKHKEDARVAKLIQVAEDRVAQPTGDGMKRAGRLLKSGHRAATTRLLLTTDTGTEQVLEQARRRQDRSQEDTESAQTPSHELDGDVSTAEERLSLTVAKEDFGDMRIAGQFNLGFIIALRPAAHASKAKGRAHSSNELFIIDQHASDEKYNFERLQATTIVQNQPLVHKQKLDLTAIEEEIIIENQDTLQKNGFEVEIDESGDSPVGQRCTLVRLPMSKEVTFSIRDLEELIALLAESPAVPAQASGPSQRSTSLTVPSAQASSFLTPVVRPSAVRKMFAMRACRSSVMIGKTLNHKHMRTLVTNMGQMEKPWNCPHGRPTMRHLYSFSQWEGWNEGDGVSGMSDDEDFAESGVGPEVTVDWASWLGASSSEEEEEEDEDGESFPEDGTQMQESDHENVGDDLKEETNET